MTDTETNSEHPAATRLFDALYERRPANRPHLSVWRPGGFERMSWDDWRSSIHRAARGVRKLGLEPRQPVPCILTNSSPVIVGVFAVWLAGGAVASLPTPARGMALDVYIEQLRKVLAQLEADVLLLEESYAAAFPSDALPGVRIATFESLLGSGEAEPDIAAPDDVIFIQYSSGSTGEPRGCLLQARAIEAQLDILAEALSLDPRLDQGVIWLPLSHDMGLFGGLMLSFVKGMPLLVSRPERFLKSPGTWFSDCADVQCTISAAPNFALELAARAARVSKPGRFPMRKCVIGGERVEAGALARAAEALGDRGLTSRSLVPAYGLAEAVLAVTMKELGTEPKSVTADSAALVDGRLELRAPAARDDGRGVTTLVSAGRPLRGVQLTVRGDQVGEICVRSPAVAAGYAGDVAATRERFHDGEVRTRDLGFVLDGELYVHGRMDDMITLGGRNIWARDIEAAITAAAPLRPGSCALVDAHDGVGTRLVLLAEPVKGASDLGAIADVASRIAHEMAGISVDECLLVPPGTVPKTPSGKLQRHRCRPLVMSDDLEPLLRR